MSTKTNYIQVLVAEPETDIQAVYRKYFDHVGLKPAIVDDAEKCLAEVFNNGASYDLVIIDAHLNGMDGIKVAKIIRSRIPDQRIIVTSTSFNGMKKELEVMGIEMLEKPFRFANLLALIRPGMSRINKVGLTDHVLAFYDNQEEEMQEAIAFIKSAIRNNETALFVMRKDIRIEEIKSKMAADGIEVDRLLSSNALIFMRNEDWYIPDRHVDKKRIIAQWHELVDRCTNSGTKGLKAFCMMDCFFENDFAEEVVDYEHTLPAKFDIPFVPICAYRKQDIDKLSEDQLKRLLVCHNHVWTK